jgi:beta-phosphoglucomutase
MMDFTKYRGVIFDLDGVITDTAKFHFLAWKKLASEIGFNLDESFDEHLKGVGRMECLELILEAACSSGGRTLFAPTTTEEKTQMANRKNSYYLEYIKTMTKADILPGIKELITLLKSREAKLAIASASFNAPHILSKLGLINDFDYIVDVTELSHGKPHPEIFTKAHMGLNLPANSCIGIEDSQAGIRAIKSANIKAIGVGCPQSLKDADIIVSDTKALLNYFTGLFIKNM